MHPRTSAAHRGRRARWRLLPAAAAALALLPAITANATLPATAAGSITIGLRTTFDYPCPSCLLAVSGTTTGDVVGVDSNGVAFEVAWPATATVANFTGNMYYTTECAGEIPEVSNIDNASNITVSDAELVYGTSHTAATVTIVFGAGIATGADLLGGIASLSVSNGAVTIPITPKTGGVFHLTPVSPFGACITGTQQGYELDAPSLLVEP